MKVLQLTKFFPPVRGGIESAVYELTEGLRDAGVDVEVLCSNTKRQTERDCFPGYSVTRAASLGRLLSTSMSPALVREMLQRRNAQDLVHVHMPDPMAALALYAARPATRVVVHWHSDVIRQRLSLKLYEPLQRWLLNRADAVIVTSEQYAEASKALSGWAHKIHIVPLGIRDVSDRVDAQKLAAVRQSYSKRRMVLAVGRMAYYKGFDTLIDAAQMLPDDAVVVIVGCGEQEAILREQVRRLGLGQRVHLPGDLSNGMLAAHIAACDVFCMPSTSRAESFGLAMVEAMSFGKPVVATEIAGTAVPWINQSGQTGLNVTTHSAEALAGALRHLLDNPDIAEQYGRAARHRFQRKFTAGQMTQRVFQIYQQVLTRHMPTVERQVQVQVQVQEK